MLKMDSNNILKFDKITKSLDLIDDIEFKSYLIITYLNASNKPEQIKEFLNFLLNSQEYSTVLKSNTASYFLKLKECLLKSSPLCGFPYVINSMNTVNEFIINNFTDLERINHNIRHNTNENDYSNGIELFSKIYGIKTDKLVDKLSNNSLDMKNFIIQDIYGKLLSNTELLSLIETELVIIISLLPLNVPPQLKSHLIGAKNLGISPRVLDQLQLVFSNLK